MRSKLLIVLAAVAMLFTACGKDNEAPEAGKNQMVYNGTVYDVTSSYDSNGVMYFYECSPATENEEEIPQFYFMGEGYVESLNTTIDLTRGVIEDLTGYWIVLTWNDGSNSSFWAANQNCTLGYGMDGGDWYDKSLFKSGTMTFTKDATAFTYRLKGVLVNDDTIDVNLYVPF